MKKKKAKKIKFKPLPESEYQKSVRLSQKIYDHSKKLGIAWYWNV